MFFLGFNIFTFGNFLFTSTQYVFFQHTAIKPFSIFILIQTRTHKLIQMCCLFVFEPGQHLSMPLSKYGRQKRFLILYMSRQCCEVVQEIKRSLAFPFSGNDVACLPLTMFYFFLTINQHGFVVLFQQQNSIYIQWMTFKQYL